jgi:dephospho-CoA kinase
VVREFGSSILDAAGRIDRRALAAQVFGSADRLAALNRLVHPPVYRREDELMAEFAAREPHGIAVVEAAILIETGNFRRYDRIVLVTCREDQQIERALRRECASESDVKARLSRQMSLEEKRKYAHFVIDTSGEKEETVRQTCAVFRELRRIEV